MIVKPMDVLTQFPVRKSARQKQQFRDAVCAYAATIGYEAYEENGRRNAKNLIIGDVENAKFLITAHYDTPKRSLFPNSSAPTNLLFTIGKLLTIPLFFVVLGFLAGYLLSSGLYLHGGIVAVFTLLCFLLISCGPANKSNANDNSSGVITVLEILSSLDPVLRQKVCFVLFDLEEAGLIGSASFRKLHQASTDKQIIFNLDCVSDGDELLFFPSKALKKDTAFLDTLHRFAGSYGRKHIRIYDHGFHHYASDHIKFPQSLGIGAFHIRKGIGPYRTRIHTSKDTVFDVTNVNILRAYIISIISQKGGSYESD